MAEGKTLAQAQRGIGFSTIMTFIVSMLIMIVGDGTKLNDTGVFTIANLSETVEKLTGRAGLWIFGLGFIAAAVSSMIVSPLGSVMTCESVFNIYGAENNDIVLYKNNKTVTDFEKEEKNKEPGKEKDLKDESKNNNLETIKSDSTDRLFPKNYATALCIVMVSVAVIVNSANAPPVKVILVAQVSFAFIQITTILILSLSLSPAVFWFYLIWISLLIQQYNYLQNKTLLLIPGQGVRNLIFLMWYAHSVAR